MPYVSEHKAKKALNCSLKELGQWRREGMPYAKEGRTFKYDLELVHRWFSGEEFPKRENPASGLLPENWREIE